MIRNLWCENIYFNYVFIWGLLLIFQSYHDERSCQVEFLGDGCHPQHCLNPLSPIEGYGLQIY